MRNKRHVRYERKTKTSESASPTKRKGVNFTLDPETAANRILRLRTPAEWAEQMKNISEGVRTEIAKIIWWDYFAARDVPDRWPDLDEYLYEPNQWATPLSKVEALVQLGFPVLRAQFRLGYISLPAYYKARRECVKRWKNKCEKVLEAPQEVCA